MAIAISVIEHLIETYSITQSSYRRTLFGNP